MPAHARRDHRKPSLVAGAALVTLLASVPAGAQKVGDVGESCRARSDCRESLRCINNVCSQPQGTICRQDADCAMGQVCQGGRCAVVDLNTPPEERGWSDFALGGTHFFAGITLAPGMSGPWAYGGPVHVKTSVMFAFRLGMLFKHTELALEIAPKTWIWDFENDLNSFSLNVSIGGLIRVAKRAYWPLRFGLGMTSGDLTKDVYMQGRLDLIGLSYQFGHLMFEVSLPSTRFHSEFQDVGIWAWLFNISIYYIV